MKEGEFERLCLSRRYRLSRAETTCISNDSALKYLEHPVGREYTVFLHLHLLHLEFDVDRSPMIVLAMLTVQCWVQ